MLAELIQEMGGLDLILITVSSFWLGFLQFLVCVVMPTDEQLNEKIKNVAKEVSNIYQTENTRKKLFKLIEEYEKK